MDKSIEELKKQIRRKEIRLLEGEVNADNLAEYEELVINVYNQLYTTIETSTNKQSSKLLKELSYVKMSPASATTEEIIAGYLADHNRDKRFAQVNILSDCNADKGSIQIAIWNLVTIMSKIEECREQINGAGFRSRNIPYLEIVEKIQGSDQRDKAFKLTKVLVYDVSNYGNTISFGLQLSLLDYHLTECIKELSYFQTMMLAESQQKTSLSEDARRAGAISQLNSQQDSMTTTAESSLLSSQGAVGTPEESSATSLPSTTTTIEGLGSISSQGSSLSKQVLLKDSAALVPETESIFIENKVRSASATNSMIDRELDPKVLKSWAGDEKLDAASLQEWTKIRQELRQTYLQSLEATEREAEVDALENSIETTGTAQVTSISNLILSVLDRLMLLKHNLIAGYSISDLQDLCSPTKTSKSQDRLDLNEIIESDTSDEKESTTTIEKIRRVFCQIDAILDALDADNPVVVKLLQRLNNEYDTIFHWHDPDHLSAVEFSKAFLDDIQNTKQLMGMPIVPDDQVEMNSASIVVQQSYLDEIKLHKQFIKLISRYLSFAYADPYNDSGEHLQAQIRKFIIKVCNDMLPKLFASKVYTEYQNGDVNSWKQSKFANMISMLRILINIEKDVSHCDLINDQHLSNFPSVMSQSYLDEVNHLRIIQKIMAINGDFQQLECIKDKETLQKLREAGLKMPNLPSDELNIDSQPKEHIENNELAGKLQEGDLKSLDRVSSIIEHSNDSDGLSISCSDSDVLELLLGEIEQLVEADKQLFDGLFDRSNVNNRVFTLSQNTLLILEDLEDSSKSDLSNCSKDDALATILKWQRCLAMAYLSLFNNLKQNSNQEILRYLRWECDNATVNKKLKVSNFIVKLMSGIKTVQAQQQKLAEKGYVLEGNNPYYTNLLRKVNKKQETNRENWKLHDIIIQDVERTKDLDQLVEETQYIKLRQQFKQQFEKSFSEHIEEAQQFVVDCYLMLQDTMRSNIAQKRQKYILDNAKIQGENRPSDLLYMMTYVEYQLRKVQTSTDYSAVTINPQYVELSQRISQIPAKTTGKLQYIIFKDILDRIKPLPDLPQDSKVVKNNSTKSEVAKSGIPTTVPDPLSSNITTAEENNSLNKLLQSSAVAQNDSVQSNVSESPISTTFPEQFPAGSGCVNATLAHSSTKSVESDPDVKSLSSNIDRDSKAVIPAASLG